MDLPSDIQNIIRDFTCGDVVYWKKRYSTGVVRELKAWNFWVEDMDDELIQFLEMNPRLLAD